MSLSVWHVWAEPVGSCLTVASFICQLVVTDEGGFLPFRHSQQHLNLQHCLSHPGYGRLGVSTEENWTCFNSLKMFRLIQEASSEFLVGSSQYLTLCKILLTLGSSQVYYGPSPICDPAPPLISWVELPLVVMWVGGITWAEVWMVVKFPGIVII